MNQNIQLLIIDPQNDFCDVPAAWCPADPLTGAVVAPALPVAGAHADMQRTAALIRAAGNSLAGITITARFGTHRVDIAHPNVLAALLPTSAAVAPFTTIYRRPGSGFYPPASSRRATPPRCRARSRISTNSRPTAATR